MKTIFRLVCALCLCQSAVRADIVLRWNEYIKETIRRDSGSANPGYSTRAMAMMNGAIYDCFQAVQHTHQPLHVNVAAASTASTTSAATEAAHRILTALYPAESQWLFWAYGYNMNQVPNGAAKDAGQALGAEVATQYLAWRTNDGSEVNVPYTPGNGPGEWRPDPLFQPVQQAWGPDWGNVLPFAIQNTAQFPVAPPPALTSAAYTTAWNEVMQYGSKDSADRTAEQTEIGLFWAYDRSGLGPPPVLYNFVVQQIATQKNNTEAQNARLFAMASVSMADACTVAWKVKFNYKFWRPTSGIREADTDGNPATTAMPSWEPLGAPGGGLFPDFTPPFPAYVSGHATMGDATFSALKAFYGTDAVSFSLKSAELPGVTRSFTSFSQAAKENSDSRIWLGVHWRFDQDAGQALGAAVAAYVSTNFFAPVVPETFANFSATHTLSGQPDADTDADGCKDFGEYAFGTNPRVRDLPPSGSMEMIGAASCVAIHYTRRPSRTAAGLTLRAEASADLQTWSTTGVTDELDPAATQTVDVEYRRAWIPVPATGRKFLRLFSQSP